MKICLISYEYDPFPGGGIATYNNAAMRILAEAGHDVHVVTNSALHGKTEEFYRKQKYAEDIGEGRLTIHRLEYFDDKRDVAPNAQFLDVCPDRYGDRASLWAAEPSNIAASRVVGYVEHLHREVGFDVIECPEFFAEAYYVLRARRSGRRSQFPPVCIHGHISSRFAFGANLHSWELGYFPHRQMMLREEYCVQEADALLTPSVALMQRYEELFGDQLPSIRETIPYFLELPESANEPPEQLRGLQYVVCVGRVEPRKGSDLAMDAFSKLASRHPDLHLVFLGKEMWHQGESVDHVIEAHVPSQFRDRVLRLGNVPREQALATARNAAAFLHPAPWDNYPCATLEAMGVGAACVVSNRGGQSEMVEHEVSGLVHPIHDADALAASIERMLTDSDFAAQMRKGAVERARFLTEPNALVERKIAMFERMVEQERREQDPESKPTRTTLIEGRAKVPGEGVVLLDAGGFDKWMVGATLRSLDDELEAAEGFRIVVLTDPEQDLELPEHVERVSTVDRPVWHGLDEEAVVVYVTAGVRFDLGRLRDLVCQVRDSRVACGSFLWLRPPSVGDWPYAPDFGWQDLLVSDQAMPPVFAVKAQALSACSTLSGLFRPHFRLAGLLAGASAGADLRWHHTGEVCGDTYRELPRMDRETQFRTLGFLDLLGLVPRGLTQVGAVPERLIAPVADDPTRDSKPAAAGSSDAGVARVEVRERVRVEVQQPDDYETLQQVYREHMALKQHKVVRAMRSIGLFGLLRKLAPSSKKLIGSGQ